MSEPIKPGDLVYVYWTHCPHESLGVPFVVDAVYSYGEGSCSTCHESLGSGPWVSGRFSAFTSQVKRIPPLSELDDVKQDQEIHKQRITA